MENSDIFHALCLNYRNGLIYKAQFTRKAFNIKYEQETDDDESESDTNNNSYNVIVFNSDKITEARNGWISNGSTQEIFDQKLYNWPIGMKLTISYDDGVGQGEDDIEENDRIGVLDVVSYSGTIVDYSITEFIKDTDGNVLNYFSINSDFGINVNETFINNFINRQINPFSFILNISSINNDSESIISSKLFNFELTTLYVPVVEPEPEPEPEAEPEIINLKIEMAGGSGGSGSVNNKRSRGTTVTTTLSLNENVDKIYICVGGKGEETTSNNYYYSALQGGYNGGGNGGLNDSKNRAGGAGGGASSISLQSGLLNTLTDSNILIVAAGGGGAGSGSGAGGGGLNSDGYDGSNSGGAGGQIGGSGSKVGGSGEVIYGNSGPHVGGGGGGGFNGGSSGESSIDGYRGGGGGGSGRSYVNNSYCSDTSIYLDMDAQVYGYSYEDGYVRISRDNGLTWQSFSYTGQVIEYTVNTS